MKHCFLQLPSIASMQEDLEWKISLSKFQTFFPLHAFIGKIWIPYESMFYKPLAPLFAYMALKQFLTHHLLSQHLGNDEVK